MKLPHIFKKDENTQNNKIATRGGSYSLAVTAVVLAILVVLNIFVSILPTAWTTYDISATKLYSITSNTKVVVNALEKDVTIYWICQSDQEDPVIENLLGKYEGLSSHIDVVKKNPDVYPTFAEKYTDETVSNNSLVVECGSKNRYIAYDDIYLTDVDYSTYQYTSSFDGEGALTSAISYVVSDDLPKLYILEGHGEAELSSSFSDQIVKENIETLSLSLLNKESVPEDADCVLIHAPESDISDKEASILKSYVNNGGKLLVFSGPVKDAVLTNLNSVLESYGVSTVSGIIVETDADYYAFQSPYILLPELQSSSMTDPLIEENYYALIPVAQGLTLNGSGTATVTELLSTSDTAYCKAAGYAIETFDKEDGDTDGPFALAVSIETGSGQIVWFSSSAVLYEDYIPYSSGANLDLAMNALGTLVGESEAVSIRSRSLDYNYLTISDSAASALSALMIVVIPAAFLICGIVTVIKRRSGKHEQV